SVLPLRRGPTVAEIPDYAPAYATNASMVVDLDDNIWIPSSNFPMVAGGPIYDVVDHRGVLIDRVQLPGGCTLVAVGRGSLLVASRAGHGTALVRMRAR